MTSSNQNSYMSSNGKIKTQKPQKLITQIKITEQKLTPENQTKPKKSKNKNHLKPTEKH